MRKCVAGCVRNCANSSSKQILPASMSPTIRKRPWNWPTPLAVMESSNIRQLATSREVYNRPASIYVADFVGEINRWKGRVESITDGAAEVSTEFGTVTVPSIAPSVGKGATGWVVIRPERVSVVLPATAPIRNNGPHFPGVVKDSIYFGARYELRVGMGQAEVTAWMADAASTRGDQVEVVLAKDSIQWPIGVISPDAAVELPRTEQLGRLAAARRS